MKIALLHYHLEPGGVTGVIKSQLKALKDDCDNVVLTGVRPPSSEFGEKAVCVPGIGYDKDNPDSVSAAQTAERVYNAIAAIWPQGCDVLHIHNPLLAKNKNFLDIISCLQKKGLALLLQVHDFAEEGRPGAYYGSIPYPENCHWAVINSRDYQILENAGLVKAGLHLLANPVTPLFSSASNKERGAGPKFVLYPVRAIRRKNIGEALLLSLYFSGNTGLAVTLPPNSPGDWKYYLQWKKFANALKLNTVFEASEKYGFETLVSNSKFFLTTSITEGFGFAFLEPWTAKKAIFGRNLDICEDFRSAGMIMDHLYESLTVPRSWIDKELFKQRWFDCIEQVYEKYGAQTGPEETEAGFKTITRGGLIDFAVLDETLQQQVIKKVQNDPGAKKLLPDINPVLKELSGPGMPEILIRANRDAVLRHFGMEAYKKRLLDAYKKVVRGPVNHAIDKERLLKGFLLPEKFSLLKWCDNEI
ncbi:MAG: hypothetical protein K9J85_04165 [Desulfobacteraceae bacterium]|nr:hypothetical protein [Desulfobacteraceae bacterium]